MTTTDALSVSPPRGMRDLLPGQVALRDWATGVILNTYSRFGFTRIETPVLEHIHLLRGGEGGENLQLIYEVLKRGDKLEKALEKSDGKVDRNELSDLGLRFDLTVPLVRYYSANQANLPNPLKAIQIGSVFRAESPQKGRFRQFTQCDIDIIGVKSEIAEIELIQASSSALMGLGFDGFLILINDRRFLAELAAYCGFEADRFSSVYIALDKLDKIGLDKVSSELIAEGHSESAVGKLAEILKGHLERQKSGQDSIEQIRAALPESLWGEFMSGLEKIIKAVDANSGGKYQIKFDPTLVRGMGYYTGPIFEIKNPGYSGSIAGGGRYDKMVGKFSGRDVPACGFSIGFERVIDILTEKGFEAPIAAKKIALIIDPDRDEGTGVLKAANKLREGENVVSIQSRKKDMKKQLDQLVAQGFTEYCAYKGDPENLELKQLSK